MRQIRLDDAALGRVAAASPHHLPLFRAARDGVIALLLPDRSAPGAAVARHLDELRRAALALIGDDDYRATGPDGWICARRLAWWGRAAIVHAAGGEAVHYETAVSMALLHERLVLVETDTAHCDAWFALFQGRAPVLGIRPPGGLPHPVLPAILQ